MEYGCSTTASSFKFGPSLGRNPLSYACNVSMVIEMVVVHSDGDGSPCRAMMILLFACLILAEFNAVEIIRKSAFLSLKNAFKKTRQHSVV